MWDVTVTCALAGSYLDASARESGAAAEMASPRKISKYAHLSEHHSFFPVAVETHGPINASAMDLLNELRRRSCRSLVTHVRLSSYFREYPLISNALMQLLF